MITVYIQRAPVYMRTDTTPQVRNVLDNARVCVCACVIVCTVADGRKNKKKKKW